MEVEYTADEESKNMSREFYAPRCSILRGGVLRGARPVLLRV